LHEEENQMAFARVNIGEDSYVYVNPDLVRVVWPEGANKCTIWFDKQHSLVVHQTAEAVFKQLEELR
jgi:hypothetical protein